MNRERFSPKRLVQVLVVELVGRQTDDHCVWIGTLDSLSAKKSLFKTQLKVKDGQPFAELTLKVLESLWLQKQHRPQPFPLNETTRGRQRRENLALVDLEPESAQTGVKPRFGLFGRVGDKSHPEETTIPEPSLFG